MKDFENLKELQNYIEREAWEKIKGEIKARVKKKVRGRDTNGSASNAS